MPHFSETSKARLGKAHPKIRVVAHEAIQIVDFSVGETQRGEEKQNRYFREGKSKLQYPNSLHNRDPSHAVHFLPYPEGWEAPMERWYYLGGIIVGVAGALDIPWRWGGDWDGDDIFSDQHFDDLAHHELRLDEGEG